MRQAAGKYPSLIDAISISSSHWLIRWNTIFEMPSGPGDLYGPDHLIWHLSCESVRGVNGSGGGYGLAFIEWSDRYCGFLEKNTSDRSWLFCSLMHTSESVSPCSSFLISVGILETLLSVRGWEMYLLAIQISLSVIFSNLCQCSFLVLWRVLLYWLCTSFLIFMTASHSSNSLAWNSCLLALAYL